MIIITASSMGLCHKDGTKVRCDDVSSSYLMWAEAWRFAQEALESISVYCDP